MLPLALMAVSCSDENKEMIAEESSNNGLKAVYRYPYGLWEPGETIQYYIKGDGTQEQKQWVKECMEEIMTYANINFKEVKRERNAITIEIDNRNSSTQYPLHFKSCSSSIGKYHTNSSGFANGGSTIYMSDIKKRFAIAPNIARQSLIKAYFKSLVLHDIFHVLGFDDEVHNPNAHITFNKAKMIAWLKRQSSDVDDLYANYVYDEEFGELSHKDFTRNNYTAFDSKSIMMIPILSEWTTDGKSCSFNYTLSDKDIQKLKELYPYGDLVKLYVGSMVRENGAYSDGIIGTKELFKDESKIRGFIGYGYTCKVYPNALKYSSDPDMAILSCFVETTMKVENGKETYIEGNDIRGALFKNLTANNGIGDVRLDSNGRGWSVGYQAYVYERVGDGRTPIITYYNNSTNRWAISYANDEYLIKKGYQAKGYIGAVKSNSKLN